MLQSVRELCRFRVCSTEGKVGKAADFYFDHTSWAVRYLVVNTGYWLIGDRILVRPNCIEPPDVAGRKIPLSLNNEELHGCANERSEQPLSAHHEALVDHRYGGSLYGRGGGPVGRLHGVVNRQALAVAQSEQTAEPDSGLSENLYSALEIVGYQTEATDGPIGAVEDFLVDDDQWVLQYMVVNTKSSIDHVNPRALLPVAWIEHLSWPESRVHLHVNRHKVKHSPRYDMGSHNRVQRTKPMLWP